MSLESVFLPYPNYMTYLSNKQTAIGYFLQLKKWPRVGFLAVLFLRPNHSRCLPLSADVYIVNSEWDSLNVMSPNANRESWRETAFPLPLIFFLSDYYSRLTASVLHILSSQPCKCMRVSYFLVTIYRTHIYIYIYREREREREICNYICLYICGALNMFPDFFVQAFKSVVDFWNFNMLLLYILWDDGPIFMISDLNEQQHTKAELSQLVNFKNVILTWGHFRRYMQ